MSVLLLWQSATHSQFVHMLIYRVMFVVHVWQQRQQQQQRPFNGL